MPHQDVLILFPIWGCRALVTLVLTQASLGPGYSTPHLGLTLTRELLSHSAPQTKLFTLVPALVLTLTWRLWSPLGLHLRLVNLVLSWSAPGSGDWSPPGLLLDLVNPVATCASPGPGTQLDRVALVPTNVHLKLVTLVLFYASP